MITNVLKKIFGSRNDRLVKQYRQTVARINALETVLEALSDEQLRAKTEEFKARHAKGESLDKLLPEAFAVCREASGEFLCFSTMESVTPECTRASDAVYID